MQYEIAGVPRTLELTLVTHLLTDADPAAVVDLAPDTRTLRISTCLDAHSVLDALRRTGIDVAAMAVDTLPSQCCGGCGG